MTSKIADILDTTKVVVLSHELFQMLVKRLGKFPAEQVNDVLMPINNAGVIMYEDYTRIVNSSLEAKKAIEAQKAAQAIEDQKALAAKQDEVAKTVETKKEVETKPK